MIFGNIAGKGKINLSEAAEICFKYYEENDLAARKPGSYPIDGKNIFVNIAEYETETEEERFWEAHRKYIDIHVLMKGQERIDTAFIENMREKPYDADKDMLILEGQAQAMISMLNAGDFLICSPQDAHRTAVHADLKNKVKKCIFKIKTDY
ncbi:YhcH/YjgK/YiaL family protein [Pectinatus haikarae]|uniref:YhcH/YjgK/YiaL family protein n=1 Tax=Pectinatus haikarae TaxID=349096 RepID=A0ABT9Y423_9FIRM|nr:YhcH/YjgK/YiaL family protein [Pectinatus haikarae]MDQ0202578.1 YhcH/YjgK/YiaL family protein [Pectinatus haikarae]